MTPSNNSNPEWFPHDDPALQPQTNDGIRLSWQNLYALRDLVATLQSQVKALQSASNNGADSSFGGDLSGSAAAATVIGIQGRPVSSVAPTTGQNLQWSGSAWVPT
jgi:hypothetical protein